MDVLPAPDGEIPGGARQHEHGDDLRPEIERIYRANSRVVLATLIRLLGDFDLAEEALHDAFVAALEQWPTDGMPGNPVAWLVSAGRFRALDHLRRRAVYDQKLAALAVELSAREAEAPEDEVLDDDRLRLIFTCCHPALAPEAQVALTLRTVCGLTTEEIARAYLVTAPTLAQRIVRAKAKIRDARIPYEVPGPAQLPERLDAVLHTIYLVFNEGYSASSGPLVTRAALAREAIRLGRLVAELTGEGEAVGLLALMLLQDARREARTSAQGDLVLLEDQDRGRWDQAQIAEGLATVERALGSGRIGAYALQAAIAAVHAGASTAAETDWVEIAALYDVLLRVANTPVVELNRAVAKAMAYGPERGLLLMDELLVRGDLDHYVHLHSARADLLRRLGRHADALEGYRRALALVTQEPERRFLVRRIEEMHRHLGSGGQSMG